MRETGTKAGIDQDERLDVRGAVEKITKALAYDAPLRVRGEGLSWMVWGLVTTAVILLAEGAVTAWSYREWYAFVLPLWAILGVLGTSAVWRLAGIARPAFSPSPGKVALGVAAGIVGFIAMTAIGWTLYEATGSYAIFALAFGAVPWSLLGWVQWPRLSLGGRRITLTLGVLMPLLFILFVELVLTDATSDGVGIAVITSIIGGVPFLVGLAWTFRR